MGVEEYQQLSAMSVTSAWFCPQCTLAQLPFANASLLNDSTSQPGSPYTAETSDSMAAPAPLAMEKTSAVFCHLNTQSFLPKRDEVNDFLLNVKRPVILGISESWLDSSVPDGLVAVKGYTHYRRDRGTRGGGVLVFVRVSCRSWRKQDLEDDRLEAVWTERHSVSGVQPLLLCNVYRPPSAPASFMAALRCMLEKAAEERKHLVMMGDLNCNLLSTNSICDQLLVITQDYNLTQLISVRLTANSQTLIDVLFTSCPGSFSTSGTALLTGSDHLMIYGEHVEQHLISRPKIAKTRCFKKCNFDDLLYELHNVPWHLVDIYTSIDEMWDCWKSMFLSVIDKHAPLQSVRMRTNSLPWVDKEIRQLQRARNFYRRKFRKSKNLDDWVCFKNLKKKVSQQIRLAKINHFSDMCTEIKKNPGQTWKRLNSLLGRRPCKQIRSVKLDEEMITDKSRLVQCFLKHFSSISLSLLPASSNGPDKVASKFQFERIEVESVLKLLSSLDSKKATGHDKISARLLKSTAPAIARSLASVFNWSLNTGEFPSEWKHAVVTPVPKSGDNQLITNYRPISVLPTIAKVFERLVHQQLYSYK